MSHDVLARFESLTTWSSGGQRAPHKPLLVLLALAEWSRGHESLRFADALDPLTELLKRFGPSRRSHKPEYPFWRLQNDQVWEVTGKGPIALGADGGATRKSLLQTEAVGRFPEDVRAEFAKHPELVQEVARRLLAAHFPDSFHEDILDAVGLELDAAPVPKDGRDPNFRKAVLVAYQHRCAVCGFQILLSGSTVALDAAHIRWHQAGGPPVVANGLCLCVLHHKLFDLGALTITPELVVLISDDVSGLAGLTEHLLTHHGKAMLKPLRPEEAPSQAFIKWHHREVFRGHPRPV